MAVAIPVIAAWGAVGAAAGGLTLASVGALATASLAGFLSVAGAALTTIGAITKKQDLMKIGGFMSLAGGIGTAVGAASAATAPATAGVSAGEAAAATAGTEAATAAAAQPTVAAAQNLGVGVEAELAKAAGSYGSQAPLLGRAGELASSSFSMIPGTTPTMPLDAISGLQPNVFADQLATGAAGIQGQSQLQTLLAAAGKKAGTALKGVGTFMKDNPELVKIGGSALSSMYGPEAEQFDFNKSIYERRMRNLNTPVRLGVLPRGG